jgi:hypothetical protein
MHQYVLLGKGSSIYSTSQLEWYNSIHVPGGIQRIVSLEGYIIPLTIKDSLVLLDIRPHTDNEFEALPHVHLTSELEWDPSAPYHPFQDASKWGNVTITTPGTLADSHFDEFGQYCRCFLHFVSGLEIQD